MIVTKTSNLNAFGNGKEREYVNSLDTDIRNIFLCVSGRVRFGDGNDGQLGENIAGQFQVVSDTGTADTEFSVSHSLGVVPFGYIVVNINKGGVVYKSTTSWTSTTVYFKCSAANANTTIFLLK